MDSQKLRGNDGNTYDDDFEVRCHTVGRDFEFTEVKVLDPETGKNVL
jgi:fatty-acyl-CoA synthase